MTRLTDTHTDSELRSAARTLTDHVAGAYRINWILERLTEIAYKRAIRSANDHRSNLYWIKLHGALWAAWFAADPSIAPDPNNALIAYAALRERRESTGY
jgi:streptomycin 6-kinase